MYHLMLEFLRLLRFPVLAVLTLVSGAAQAQSINYDDHELADVTRNLPMLFGQSIRVGGLLTVWGETASLCSETTGEVMIDLRALGETKILALNSDCAVGHACEVVVSGEVVHIRGTGISELGIRVDTIE
jgi:hypothetical protein